MLNQYTLPLKGFPVFLPTKGFSGFLLFNFQLFGIGESSLSENENYQKLKQKKTRKHLLKDKRKNVKITNDC